MCPLLFHFFLCQTLLSESLYHSRYLLFLTHSIFVCVCVRIADRFITRFKKGIVSEYKQITEIDAEKRKRLYKITEPPSNMFAYQKYEPGDDVKHVIHWEILNLTFLFQLTI